MQNQHNFLSDSTNNDQVMDFASDASTQPKNDQSQMQHDQYKPTHNQPPYQQQGINQPPQQQQMNQQMNLQPNSPLDKAQQEATRYRLDVLFGHLVDGQLIQGNSKLLSDKTIICQIIEVIYKILQSNIIPEQYNQNQMFMGVIYQLKKSNKTWDMLQQCLNHHTPPIQVISSLIRAFTPNKYLDNHKQKNISTQTTQLTYCTQYLHGLQFSILLKNQLPTAEEVTVVQIRFHNNQLTNEHIPFIKYIKQITSQYDNDPNNCMLMIAEGNNKNREKLIGKGDLYELSLSDFYSQFFTNLTCDPKVKDRLVPLNWQSIIILSLDQLTVLRTVPQDNFSNYVSGLCVQAYNTQNSQLDNVFLPYAANMEFSRTNVYEKFNTFLYEVSKLQSPEQFQRTQKQLGLIKSNGCLVEKNELPDQKLFNNYSFVAQYMRRIGETDRKCMYECTFHQSAIAKEFSQFAQHIPKIFKQGIHFNYISNSFSCDQTQQKKNQAYQLQRLFGTDYQLPLNTNLKQTRDTLLQDEQVSLGQGFNFSNSKFFNKYVMPSIGQITNGPESLIINPSSQKQDVSLFKILVQDKQELQLTYGITQSEIFREYMETIHKIRQIQAHNQFEQRNKDDDDVSQLDTTKQFRKQYQKLGQEKKDLNTQLQNIINQ